MPDPILAGAAVWEDILEHLIASATGEKVGVFVEGLGEVFLERLDVAHVERWRLSVRRRSPYLGPTFGLFDPALDLRGEPIDGLAPDFVFGPYRENPAEFSCELEDELDVATLLRLVFREI